MILVPSKFEVIWTWAVTPLYSQSDELSRSSQVISMCLLSLSHSFSPPWKYCWYSIFANWCSLLLIWMRMVTRYHSLWYLRPIHIHVGGGPNFDQNDGVWFACLFKYFSTPTVYCSQGRIIYLKILDDYKRANWYLEWEQFYRPRYIGAFECDKGPFWLSVVYNQVII